jgi:serine/threonine protein phosphatase PrpC
MAPIVQPQGYCRVEWLAFQPSQGAIMSEQGIVLSLFGRSDEGKGRQKNEDTFVVSDFTETSPINAMISHMSLAVGPRGVLIAVSDGMGGARAGEVASSLALDALQRGLSTAEASNADIALRASVEDANQQVFENARATARDGMGATLTAVLFHGLYASIAEIGDSRAYRLRGNSMVQLTHDQTYVQELIDAGAITARQAEDSDFKSVIMQAMGLGSDIVVAMSRVSVQNEDLFLVCSDGLSGAVNDDMMRALIADSATLELACARLVETAVELGSEDDITVVLVKVGGDGAPETSPPS